MELKTNYQYSYFIYPFAIKEENYKRYIKNLIKNKKFKIKFFDYFKDVELYKYFVPTVKQDFFQDFSFDKEKINKFNKLSYGQQIKILENQNCLIFEYLLKKQIQGKIEEKDGIFFTIPKIELICFNTGICFLSIKTHLEETNNFSDILNFNYKFNNIKLENKNIKKIKDIKIQTDMFENMTEISSIIEEITGKKIEGRKLDIDEDLFLTYTYVCIEANQWNNENSFENIENEFVKLAEVKKSNTNINVDYEKLSVLTNSSFMKIRINDKCAAVICSSADVSNYTVLPELYENQYFYTYILALHQRYYLKKLNRDFDFKTENTIKKFIKFTNTLWISEITSNSFGQKFYKRCKEKLNLEELFAQVKTKYDIYYKKLNIEKNRVKENTILIATVMCLLIGVANFISWLFVK